MNLDSLTPCYSCGAYVRSVFHMDEETPEEIPEGPGALYQEWNCSRWSWSCSCGIQIKGEPGTPQPTYRNRSPEMATEIERLRVQSGKSTNTLKVIGSVAIRSGLTFYSWSDGDQNGVTSDR